MDITALTAITTLMDITALTAGPAAAAPGSAPALLWGQEGHEGSELLVCPARTQVF